MGAPHQRGKLLLFGEPGAGKTSQVLARARQLMRAGREDFRLVTPTATMAEHLRNTLAREGYVVRPKIIRTLAEFVAELSPEAKPVSQTALAVLMREVLEEEAPAYFLPMRGNPGLASALCSAIDDLANAGCDSLQWAALGELRVHSGPLAAALGAAYEALERKLQSRGLQMRAPLLAGVARDLGSREEMPIGEVLFDGFFSFTRSELELIRALSAWARVTVTLPEWPGVAACRAALAKMGFREERGTVLRPAAAVTLIAAGNPAREAGEIGLRLMELHERGVAWSEMGVVVRNAQRYGRLLETTFARLGIPTRSYLGTRLGSHAVFRQLDDLVAAILSGWEFDASARVLLSPVGALGKREDAGQLDHLIREALPGEGLSELQAACASASLSGELAEAVERLAPLSDMREESGLPGAWAERLSQALSGQVSRGEAMPRSREEVLLWQTRAAALRGTVSALREIAELLPAVEMPLAEFWRRARQPVADSMLRTKAHGRDTVHLLDVQEARQWELKAVFLCGLLEGEFPRRVAADPILSEDVRFKLKQAGVPVSTRQDLELEEQFLLKFALSRSRGELQVSWPEHDMDGRSTLRSFAVDELDAPVTAGRVARIEPAGALPLIRRTELIQEESLELLRRRHARLRTTALENFLQCPFQFFGRHSLKLRQPPKPPERRLDLPTQGTLIHDVLAEWQLRDGQIESTLEAHWERLVARLRIPPSYRAEVARLAILRGLRFFVKNSRRMEGNRIEVERDVRLTIAGTPIDGRLDRIDFDPRGEAVVYDFKYSGATSLKKRLKKVDEGLAIQGGLYLAAARAEGIRATAFVYVGLRGDTAYEEFREPERVEPMVELAVALAGRSIEQILRGEIGVKPADLDSCRYCELRQACRLGVVEQAEVAGG
jgi:ATP-dependent helicase/DNAse subunit B